MPMDDEPRDSGIRTRLHISKRHMCYPFVKNLDENTVRQWAMNALDFYAAALLKSDPMNFAPASIEQPEQMEKKKKTPVARSIAPKPETTEPNNDIAKLSGLKIADFTKNVKW